jgi:hypothetical protein
VQQYSSSGQRCGILIGNKFNLLQPHQIKTNNASTGRRLFVDKTIKKGISRLLTESKENDCKKGISRPLTEGDNFHLLV